MNRQMYDSCAYKEDIKQSTSPLSYVLDPIKYENCHKCRPELGLVGGTAVSHVRGNLIDLENSLRNQDRPNTHCDAYKWMPQPPEQHWIQGKEYIKPVQHPRVDTDMVHLKPCQFSQYRSVPPTPPMDLYRCQG